MEQQKSLPRVKEVRRYGPGLGRHLQKASVRCKTIEELKRFFISRNKRMQLRVYPSMIRHTTISNFVNECENIDIHERFTSALSSFLQIGLSSWLFDQMNRRPTNERSDKPHLTAS